MINILENGNVYIDEVTCIDFSMCVAIFVKYVTTPTDNLLLHISVTIKTETD